MLEIAIRECRAEDYADIALLNKNELGYDYPEHETQKQLERLLKLSSHKVYVAVHAEKVVGYIHANDYDITSAPHLKNIMNLAVATAFQGQGIGRQLLDEAEKWALDTGAAGIRLTSAVKRAGAHAFYAACGYINVKDQKNFKKML